MQLNTILATLLQCLLDVHLQEIPWNVDKYDVAAINAHAKKMQEANKAEYFEQLNRYFDKNYNPNHGYEPYWPGGNWVFRDKTLPPGVTSTSVPLVCGEECDPLYTTLGAVCGRQVDNIDYNGYSCFWMSCHGIEQDDHGPGYRTFKTYCRFLDTQCRSPFMTRWFFVHYGACIENQKTIIKPLDNSKMMISRMAYYVTRLAQVYRNHSSPNPFEA